MQTTYANTTIGLDLAKNVFYYTELNRNLRVVRQARLSRSQVFGYFPRLESSKVRCVAMEACGSVHFWGRKFQELGLVVECSRSRVDGLIERVLIDDPALREGWT